MSACHKYRNVTCTFIRHGRRCLPGKGLGRGWLWPMEHELQIGMREVWGGWHPFGLSNADRARHIYIIGQTGTGKSTLIRELIGQDIVAGRGCALIDPHGDLAHDVLDLIPKHRTDDVVLLDPSDTAFPVGINPFYHVKKDNRSLVAANLVATMKHIWRDSWGPRLEYILYNTIAALLDAPDHLRPSVLSIPLLLVNRQYRAQVIAHIEDPQVRSFFANEFASWNERQLADYLSSTQNKVGQFVSNPFIRNILGQWRPTVDFSDVINTGKIFIARLSKGTLGEEPANLLGSLIVSGFQQAAMQRADVSEEQRKNFHIYIDEFQNFTTDAFASMLSEIRKYGVSITAANQYLDQLSFEVRSSVFGNVGNLIVFRVSARDAENLSHEIGEFVPSQFRDLECGHICTRLMSNGKAGAPYFGVTRLPTEKQVKRKNAIVEQCRQRYSAPRQMVEQRIDRWLGSHQ